MNLIKWYHTHIWTPLAWKIARRVMRCRVGRRFWKLFCAHLQILAVLQIIAQPFDDVACYCYILFRAKYPMYKYIPWKRKLELVDQLWKEAWR